MALKFIIAVVFLVGLSEAKKVHYVHWNRASPMFRIDNTDHIVDVKEFDQVNLICPVSKPGNGYPERHVIYSVSREEYDSCRITNPKPKIVAICNRPHRLMYFTITFRSFTPTPGGLEFRPGQDYYFISTSSNEDLHRRVGGGCSTHNMKMIFKVHENPQQRQQEEENKLKQQQILDQNLNSPRFNLISDSTTEKTHIKSEPITKTGSYIYYYRPRDVVAMETAAYKEETNSFNEVIKNSALPYTYNLRRSVDQQLHSSSVVFAPINVFIMTLAAVILSC